MYRFNEMLFAEMIENLNCRGRQIPQPIDKKTLGKSILQVPDTGMSQYW